MAGGIDSLSDLLDIDPSRPLFAAFPNLVWDSAAAGRDVGFAGLTSWLTSTIEIFSRRPNWQLVIRTHPAEVRSTGSVTQERLADNLKRHFKSLPANVCVIPPESPINSYALMRLADVGLVYTSTVGLEMALMGKPVCCAGKVHYRGRGFTFDVERVGAYESILEAALTQMALRSDQLQLARRFAYCVLFRVPIPGLRSATCSDGGDLLFPLSSFEEVIPGRHAEIGHICSAILEKQSFLLPRHRVR